MLPRDLVHLDDGTGRAGQTGPICDAALDRNVAFLDPTTSRFAGDVSKERGQPRAERVVATGETKSKSGHAREGNEASVP